METGQVEARGLPHPSSRFRDLLLPDPPRRLPLDRVWRVGARTVHICAMSLVLGGLAFGIPHARLMPAVWTTVASGLVLLGLDCWKSLDFLRQGSGVGLMAKLALLGLAHLVPGGLFPLYLAGTALASIASHMSGTWRHKVLLFRGKETGA